MRQIVRIIAITLLVGCACVNGQPSPSFEVSSIKPSQDQTGADITILPGDALRATHVSLRQLIQFAFEVKELQIGTGLAWLDTEKYDIAAKPNSAVSPPPPARLMLQAMLLERFSLKFHRQSLERSVYALTVTKSGARLVEHTGDGRPTMVDSSNRVTAILVATRATMPRFAEGLGRMLDRVVIDDTGLTGEYDLKLEWAIDPSADSAGPAVFTAVQNNWDSGSNPGRRRFQFL